MLAFLWFFAVPVSHAQEFMPVDEIETGMRGRGWSVFTGTEIAGFDVEILGVMRNALGPKQDMILARLTGDPVDRAGVIAGMSGSPVYIDGRLIGAVSYRIGSFTHEAIAGITPIQDMLKLEGISRRVHAGSATDLLEGLVAQVEGKGAGQADPPGNGWPARKAAGGAGAMEPIRTPLVFSGFSPEVFESIAPFFEGRGFHPVLGGGGGEDAGAPGQEALVGGAPVAGQLVRGDIGIAASGTVTYRDGDHLFAFGHPFLGMGSVEIPMATARVLHTLPSSLGSFKITAPGEVVGTFLEDRLTAIYGEVGPIPAMIPVELTLRTAVGSRTFAYEIFKNPVWTPTLLFLTLGNGMVGTIDYSSAGTLEMNLRIRFDGYPDLVIENVYTSLGRGLPLPFLASLDVARMFSFLYGNLFEQPVVEKLEFTVNTGEETKFALVTSLRVPSVEVEPGEEIPVEVFLTPYRDEPTRQVVMMKVPEDTPPGPMILIAGSHRSLATLEGGLLGFRLNNARSLQQILRILGEERRNDHLYLKLYRKVSGTVVQSEVLTDLPPSVLSVLDSKQVSRRRTKLSIASVEGASVPTDWILLGGQRVDLKVK